MAECHLDTTCTGENSTLLIAGGQILPLLTSLSPDGSEWKVIQSQLKDTVHPVDFLVLFVLGWASIPVFGVLYYGLSKMGRKQPYDESYAHLVADHISQIARLAIVVYVIDCLVVILDALGFSLSNLSQASKGFAKILYAIWFAQRCSVFKRYLLSEAFAKSPSKLGRAAVLDRLGDGMICVFVGFFLCDVLEVEMGMTVSSLFAFGSLGTVMFGLASQDIASTFLSGLQLSMIDLIREGEEIRFGDGTAGIVQKLGWMQTTVRNYNELIDVIPNSQIGHQRITNVSRCERCQVKENLRIRYEDAEKLPKCLVDILEEIKKSCPKAITDGSRPFRAVWHGYGEDHLKVIVQAHFELPPVGAKYWANRQVVMVAIHRAIKNNDCHFVTTLWPATKSSQE